MASQEELMDVDELPCTLGNSLNGRKLTRGEKSKIAAKSRRDKENVAFHDLVAELPLPNDVLNKMDKASVIRLAICYLKLKHFLQKDIKSNSYKDIPKESCRSILHSLKSSTTPDELDREGAAEELKNVEGQMMLDALNGFLIFINKKYSIRFISASVTDHLGLSVENLVGRNVHEFIHPCDKAELAKHFMPDGTQANGTKRRAVTDKSCPVSTEDKSQKVFYLRMKHHMSKHGSRTKQAGYTLVQWSGKLKQHMSSKTGSLVTDGLVCICRPMQTSSVMEIRMDGNMFMSRHDLGMTFTFCDTRIVSLIGYEPNELLGKTAYHFHNPIDAPKVSDCHQNLIIKGTSVSKYYRFLGKNDNWVWLQTRATIIYNTANKPQYIVCMNYVISEEEGERYLMLEEHKHANIDDENAVVTLPDNHNPMIVFHTEDSQTSGPTIVELEDKNLKRTACLNEELDTQGSSVPYGGTVSRQQPSNSTNLLCNKSVVQQMSDTFVTMVESEKKPENQCYPCRNNSSNTSKQIYPQNSEGSLLLQSCIPQHVVSRPGAGVETIHIYSQGSSCPTLPDQTIPTKDDNQPSMLVGDTSCFDSSVNNLFPGSCQSNYSHSEDGGYESASSPASSHRSPQVVSPYSSDISERGYTDMVMDRGMVVNQDSNPAIIKNCDFGVGYPVDYEQMNDTQMFDEEKPSYLPDPENILDELLQSFSQPSTNLDENMAVVFSTIESLTQQNGQTITSNVNYPNVHSESKKVFQNEEKVNNQPKVDKSVLRHILTIPEDKIPKQPVSYIQPSTDPVSLVTKLNNRDNIPCFVKKNTLPKSCVQGITSGERLVHSMIHKSIVQRTKEEQDTVQTNFGQSNVEDQSVQLPDDISDFALQYMETLPGDESGDDLPEFNDDILMDTSESELTKGLIVDLENQCNNTQARNTQIKFPAINRNEQFPCNTGQNGKLKGNDVVARQQMVNFGGQGNKPLSPYDHVYVQKNNRSQRLLDSTSMCNRVCSNKPVSFGDSRAQTSSKPPVSELEKHLLAADRTPIPATASNKSPCGGESSLLQQLLTGELSKDTYMQMELSRVPRRQGVKPN